MPCIGQVLNREGWLFLGFVKQAENHIRAAYVKSVRVEVGILQWAFHEGFPIFQNAF